MSFLGIFRKTPPPNLLIDKSVFLELDNSFQLLQSTAATVSSEAIKAAHSLKDRLEDSEDRFFQTIDSLNDIVIVKSGDGKWKTVNVFGQYIFGMNHGEYYDKTSAELAKEFPRLQNLFEDGIHTDELAWENGAPTRFERQIPTNNNECRQFDFVKTPTFNSDGTRKELIVVGRDITELEEKQKRTKACFVALNSASEPISILDRRGRVFFCNDKFISIFHLGMYIEIIGEKLQNVIKCITDYDLIWETIQQNKTWSKNYDLSECTNPSFVNVNLTIVPVMNGEPRPVYYICTFKPISLSINS